MCRKAAMQCLKEGSTKWTFSFKYTTIYSPVSYNNKDVRYEWDTDKVVVADEAKEILKISGWTIEDVEPKLEVIQATKGKSLLCGQTPIQPILGI